MQEELAAYPALYAEAAGFDPSITLTTAVVVAAAAIDYQIQVCASGITRWFAQARIWKLDIGAPGSGKTPAARELLAPLWDLHRELEARWQAAGRELAKEELTEDDSPPPRPRVIVTDPTIEKLSDVLVDNPRGVLIARDEFDAWLGAMDQYRNNGNVGSARGDWLAAFDGGPRQIERVKRGSIFVPNWGVSIVTATTPARLQRLTRELPEDGLLQRFLPVIDRRQQFDVRAPPVRAEMEVERNRYVELIRRLYAMTPRSHNGVVPMSADAQERFRTWLVENQTTQEALGSIEPALESHIAKYPTYALRLALIFHCVRTAQIVDERGRDPASYPIALDTLERALAFLRRARRHALALYLNRDGSEAYDLARTIARYISARQDHAQSLQRRDLLRHVKAFNAAKEGLQATSLRLLADLGWLRDDSRYSKEQPTRYLINPALSARFAELAAKERERRAAVRALITESVEQRRADRVSPPARQG